MLYIDIAAAAAADQLKSASWSTKIHYCTALLSRSNYGQSKKKKRKNACFALATKEL